MLAMTAETGSFQTTGRALYRVEGVDADHAAAVGCPTATHRIEGRTGVVYGYFMATGTVPGRPVRVPGWPTRRGMRALFVPAVLDESGPSPVAGFLAFDADRS